ncbi:MAG TPA: methyltransferase domain-containing protein [Desulfomonilaceae bacterium]|nr:methyltransferase domain-containing protein [Desulfomonilaceae bacterium]
MRDEQFELHARIEEAHWWFRGRRSIINRIAGHVLPASCRGMIIDIGCGTGANLAALASDHDCLGIDVSENAIRLARQRFSNVEFLHSDLRHLAVPAYQGPRLWLLLDVLEHVEDDISFFSTILSVMEENDHLLMTVPANMSLWSPHDAAHGHYRRYHRAMLEKLWKGREVTVIFVTYFNFFLFPIIYAVRAYNRLRKKEWGEAGTDLDLPGPWLNGVLESIFSSEGAILEYLMKRGRRTGWPFGVSLMALLRKGSK